GDLAGDQDFVGKMPVHTAVDLEVAANVNATGMADVTSSRKITDAKIIENIQARNTAKAVKNQAMSQLLHKFMEVPSSTKVGKSEAEKAQKTLDAIAKKYGHKPDDVIGVVKVNGRLVPQLSREAMARIDPSHSFTRQLRHKSSIYFDNSDNIIRLMSIFLCNSV